MMRLPTLLILSGSIFVGSALGCGGSKKSPNEGGGGPVAATEGDAQSAEGSEERFARQKDDAVEKMCQRMVDCQLQDADANMAPEELAELNKARDGITAAAIADCNNQYGEAQMSPRQVVALRECLGQPTECTEFFTCLDKVWPPKAPETP
ncbi:MAG: hypothetical protein GY811_08950 [Myxococcales bacterium]|nr:hypothetical protein [Myxococcales bacterium]